MVQLVTDSCCDLPYEVLAAHQIDYLPMTIQLNGEELYDDLGVSFDYEGFLEAIQEGAMPTTSQINIGRYLEFFRGYVEANIPVLYIAFSSGMSGSYQSAQQAVAILEEEYEREVEIVVFDSKNASLAQGMLVLEADKMKRNGASVSEIVASLEKKKATIHSWVTVDDLDHLQRGGRISKTAAALGGLMHVKPIIVVSPEGKLESVGKARGRKKALQTIVDETKKTILNPEEQTLYIAFAGDQESAEKVKELVKEQLPVQDVILYPLGPTITSHTGYGCVALFSFGIERV